jgi:hypothetical protein
MSDIEDLRKAANSDVPRRALAELMLESKGDPVGALLELLAAAAAPAPNDVATFCAVSLVADCERPDANDAVGDYLEFDVDAPFIDQENWPKEVLLVGLSKEGRVAVTQTVNVMEFVEENKPQWLGEVED